RRLGAGRPPRRRARCHGGRQRLPVQAAGIRRRPAQFLRVHHQDRHDIGYRIGRSLRRAPAPRRRSGQGHRGDPDLRRHRRSPAQPPPAHPLSRIRMTQPDAATKTPRRLDPEDAQHALAEVQERLRRQQLGEDPVHRQEQGDNKASLVEDLVHRQHEAELKALVDALHPADIAFILESLPKDERQNVWRLVSPEHDADVLLEVEDWVRESLIEAMDRQDLVAATGNMDADELADLAPDLPPDVVAEVQKGLTDEERAQLLEAMGYPEDSVGAIMDFEMVRVREDVTLEVVLRYLRRLHELPDHTDQVFVV